MKVVERWHPDQPKSTRFILGPLIDQGYDIEVGDFSYGAPSIRWVPDERRKRTLRIGKYCSFAADIDIYVGRLGRHTTDFLSTYPVAMVHGPLKQGDISAAHEGDLNTTIGSDVWIGRGAQIMAGSTIGHGAVVGAKSLVTGDVPPYSIAVGTPAKVIRLRFDPSIIDRLLALRWWELPPAVLAANSDIFNKRDMAAVVERLEQIFQSSKSC